MPIRATTINKERQRKEVLVVAIVSRLVFAVTLALAVAGPVIAQNDPSQETVLIGELVLPDMRIRLELEPAKSMRMPTESGWMEMAPAPGERFHVEVKPEDPQSTTRLSYAQVSFSATDQDTGATIDLDLHPMWGSSGLHYANNSDLPDGTYIATVVVGVPTFARAPADAARWATPTWAQFGFELRSGLLVSASVIGGGEEPTETTPSEVVHH